MVSLFESSETITAVLINAICCPAFLVVLPGTVNDDEISNIALSIIALFRVNMMMLLCQII